MAFKNCVSLVSLVSTVSFPPATMMVGSHGQPTTDRATVADFDVENITCENVEPALKDRELAIEDSPDSGVGVRNRKIPEGAKPTEASGETIPNPPSKIQSGKRPYVKTPARLAAMLANLEKARAAPKEKVYRPSEKRRAANRANLQKAHAARAAARAEQQAFGERIERLFPPFAPGKLLSTEEGREEGTAGMEGVREVAEGVWQRRRFYPRQARREGRKVMRLLTAAAQGPAPSSVEEAFHLWRPLLEIFLRSQAVGRAERLNAEIRRRLLEMLEGRYGPEVFPDGFALASSLRETEALLNRMRAEEKAEREERRAARGKQAPEEGAEADEGMEEAGPKVPPKELPPAGAAAPDPAHLPIPPGKVPELPEKFEDFLEIFCRAFPPPSPGRATEGDQVLLGALARAVWERLHVYERQVEQEEAGLHRVVDEVGAEAVQTYRDLRVRSHLIEIAFKTEPALRPEMARLEAEIELGINQLLKWRYGSELDQEIFPPPPGVTVPVTSSQRLDDSITQSALG
jgi:hypothetical protein